MNGKKGLKDRFDSIVQPTNYQELVHNKYLVPTVTHSPEGVNIDLSNLALQGGDFKQDDLFKRYDSDRVYKGVVNAWKAMGENRQTIVFTTSSKIHARRQCEWFNKMGVPAKYVTGDTRQTKQDNQRAKIIDDFKKGKFKVLVNIGIFTEGIDINSVSCIVMACATRIPSKFFQALTRASRPIWNDDYSDWKRGWNGQYLKEDALIIDLGSSDQSNTGKFGIVDYYDLIPFTLHGIPPKGEAPVKRCKACGCYNHIVAKFCRDCGSAFPIKEKQYVHVDELTFHKQERSNHIFDKILRSSHKKMMDGIEKSGRIELLPLIQIIKGYKKTWIAHAAYKTGLFPEDLDPHKYPDSISILNQKVFEKFKKSAFFEHYNRFKKQFQDETQ